MIIQLATSRKELDQKSHLIVSAMEAKEVLLDDIESLKESLMNVGKTVHLNWDRIKVILMYIYLRCLKCL